MDNIEIEYCYNRYGIEIRPGDEICYLYEILNDDNLEWKKVVKIQAMSCIHNIVVWVDSGHGFDENCNWVEKENIRGGTSWLTMPTITKKFYEANFNNYNECKQYFSNKMNNKNNYKIK